MRVLPKELGNGCAFAGPGVDLYTSDAERVFACAKPLLGWLLEREPGASIRSLSFDLIRLRVLVTLNDPSLATPRVVRVDPPLASELFDLAKPTVELLCTLAEEALRRRV